MSAKRSKKISKLMMALLPIAFLSIIGIVALAIVSVISIAKSELPAENNGIPGNWVAYEEVADVDSKITARMISDKYIEYTASLKNNSTSDELIITHLSSYINGNKNSGFVSLSSDSLEYTYEPNRANSWTPVSINDPGTKANNFAFDYDIYIGQAGTKTDTIYFRFNVNISKDGLVDNVISYVTEDQGIITDSVSIDTDAENSSAEKSDEVTSWATISSMHFDKASRNNLSNDVIIISAAIGIFALGVAVYLVCRI